MTAMIRLHLRISVVSQQNLSGNRVIVLESRGLRQLHKNSDGLCLLKIINRKWNGIF